MHRTKVRVAEGVLDANETIARANRADFDRAGVRVVNLMSAPGAGKTTLLERVLADGVLAAKSATAAARAPVSWRATSRARSMRSASRRFTSRSPSSTPTPASAASATSTPTWSAPRCRRVPLDEIDLLVIENVGNLVCPAEFRVGEDARAMVSSVTEGEDKPLKYPLMFRACELVVVNKIDLLPHLDFSLEDFLGNLERVNPGVEHMLAQRAHRRGRGRLRGLARGGRLARAGAAVSAGAARPARGSASASRVSFRASASARSCTASPLGTGSRAGSATTRAACCSRQRAIDARAGGLPARARRAPAAAGRGRAGAQPSRWPRPASAAFASRPAAAAGPRSGAAPARSCLPTSRPAAPA